MTESPGHMQQFSVVAFRLAERVCALPIESVLQIIQMVTITPVSLARSLLGVINVRGATVPVVNLACLLGLPDADLRLDTPIILARICGRSVGLVVDEVIDVLRIPSAQLSYPVDVLPQSLEQMPMLAGLAQTAHGMVLILDPDRLFSPGRAAALTQMIDNQVDTPCADCSPCHETGMVAPTNHERSLEQ